MPTPSSGTISMLDMRNEITRGGGAVDMATIRQRYGSSGAISFNQLYRCEGFVVVCQLLASGKGEVTSGFVAPGPNIAGQLGAVIPNESNGRIQFAAASFLNSFVTSSFDEAGNRTRVSIIENNTQATNAGGFQQGNNNAVTNGFRVTNLTRVVIDNVVRGINNTQDTTAFVNYTMPATDPAINLECLLQF